MRLDYYRSKCSIVTFLGMIYPSQRRILIVLFSDILPSSKKNDQEIMENFDSIAISHKFSKLLIILGSEKIDKT